MPRSLTKLPFNHILCDFNVLSYSKLSRRSVSQITCNSQESHEVFLNEKYARKRDTDYKQSKKPSLIVTKDNQYELLNNLVTPLWKTPYDKQLHLKWKYSNYVLNQFCPNEMKSKCELEWTIASPLTEGYRNKSEMNLRKGVDGNDKTVGCFIGATGVNHKAVICVPPTHLPNTSERHKELTQMYQDFIRTSPLPAMHDLFDSGYWRGIVIRTNMAGDTMVISYVHPQNYTEHEIHENALKMKKYFEDRNAGISSLYYQACCHTRCTNDMSPYKLLSGQPYLTETLLGYNFQISPDSFFQINKSAAELLYSNVIRVAQLKPSTVVLDLCCGTGTISILCSPHVRCCVGIDVTSQAIEDAKENAKENNVTNCRFIVGKIEKTLQNVLNSLNNATDIVAILNPSRNGVDPGIIKAIRYCPQISRVVYVSCKADAPGTIKNFVDLRHGNLCTGARFLPKSITPVDLFPHTYHCELIIMFERENKRII